MCEIWEEIKNDCESGARRLVAEYGDRLYAAAILLCPSAADAEELVFRTFERAVSRNGQFKSGGEYVFRNGRLMGRVGGRWADWEAKEF